MQKLSEAEIAQRIASGQCFECDISDGSFSLKIESYTPTICVALHAGHRLRSELIGKCALNDTERYYEEDPYTEQMIQAMPITLIAHDSRYEYDLNRPVATCIYRKAWGKDVWRKNLSPRERRDSTAKHQAFYRILDALVQRIEQLFGAALIFDIHSYNHLRRNETVIPTFNLGTEQLDKDRWKPILERTLTRLAQIELPNMPVVAAKNCVFYGRGYLASHTNSRFQHTLVLPIEVKKIFMDELSGEVYPLVLQSLVQQMKDSMVDISTLFARRYTRKRRARKADMLTEKMDPAIIKLDRALYQVAKGLETLYYINPINIPGEKKKFFKSNANYQPNLVYRQLDIDPYLFREQLYRLPVDDIRDPGIQGLYRDVINSLSEKVGMLVRTGRPDFLYESLKYYGEPGFTDLQNAHFILHTKEFEPVQPAQVTTELLLQRFRQQAKCWGMACKVESSAKLVASAMVSNAKKSVMIGKNLCLSETEAAALINHELGVHMATTLNASQQRLKVFSLGLPGNTLAQEGLAILNEYQSGNMTLPRLKGLALRVLAVKEMINQGDFRHTYSYLFEEHRLTADEAFKLAVRVHRGGGFTKDYLYLNGVSQALDLVRQNDIRNLYIGKTSFQYLDIINEMVARGWAGAPQYFPEYLSQPVTSPVVLDYLMSCIRGANTGLTAQAGATIAA